MIGRASSPNKQLVLAAIEESSFIQVGSAPILQQVYTRKVRIVLLVPDDDGGVCDNVVIVTVAVDHTMQGEVIHIPLVLVPPIVLALFGRE